MNVMAEQFGRIGVLMGGISSEREISQKSGKAIVEALNRQNCNVVSIDIVDDNEEKIIRCLQELKIDLAFIALHGKLGEDGYIQSLLDSIGMAYTGSGEAASRLAFNKAISQELFKKNNIRVPPFAALEKNNSHQIDLILEEAGPFPVIIKPASEGSSVGISVVNDHDALEDAMNLAWQYDDVILLEQYIIGRELTVGVLDGEALSVIEIRPQSQFFDYKSKYTKGLTDYIVPADIPSELGVNIKEDALKAHKLLSCADFSRVDFMLDDQQKHYVLELNTIPGFTSTSLLPMAAKQKGVNFDQLCLKLLELAHGKKKEIQNTSKR